MFGIIPVTKQRFLFMINLSSLVADLETTEILPWPSIFKWNQSIKTFVANKNESACADYFLSKDSCSL